MKKTQLLKAHVKAYTRKDGTFVKEHTTNRQAAKPKQPGVGNDSAHGDRQAAASSFSEGQSVKVTSNVNGKGKVGIIRHVDASKGYHVVKFEDGSQSVYHESDLSADDGWGDDGDDEIMTKAAGALLLAKAHVKAYTRRDGTFVKEHDTSVQAARQDPPGSAGGAQEEKTPPSVESKNKEWGFHGEARTAHLAEKHGGDDWPSKSTGADYDEAEKSAGEKFSAAAHHLVKEGHFKDHDEARDYLDSRHGRHLHDAAYPHGDISKVSWLAKDVGHYKKSKGALFNESNASKRPR